MTTYVRNVHTVCAQLKIRIWPTLQTTQDVYSWAVIMAELLTGQLPWYGVATMAIIYNVVFKKERPELPGARGMAGAAPKWGCWSAGPCWGHQVWTISMDN